MKKAFTFNWLPFLLTVSMAWGCGLQIESSRHGGDDLLVCASKNLTLSTDMDPSDPPEEKDAFLLNQLVSFQSWGTVSSPTEGLIFQNKIAGVNAIGWGRQVSDRDAFQPAGNYLYSTRNRSPHVPYFKGLVGNNSLANFQVETLENPNSDQRGKFIHDASMLSPSLGSAHGLSKAAHIVKMRVNDGKNGVGLHFIADEVEVLEGKNGLTLDPVELITKVATEFDPQKTAGIELREKLDKAIAAREAGRKFDEDKDFKPSLRQGFQASWHPVEKKLKVLYYVQLVHHRTVTTKNPSPLADKFGCEAPPGADCAPFFNDEFIVKNHFMTSEFAKVYEFDQTGKQTKVESHHVRAWEFATDPANGKPTISATGGNSVVLDKDQPIIKDYVDNLPCK